MFSTSLSRLGIKLGAKWQFWKKTHFPRSMAERIMASARGPCNTREEAQEWNTKSFRKNELGMVKLTDLNKQNAWRPFNCWHKGPEGYISLLNMSQKEYQHKTTNNKTKEQLSEFVTIPVPVLEKSHWVSLKTSSPLQIYIGQRQDQFQQTRQRLVEYWERSLWTQEISLQSEKWKNKKNPLI